MSDLSPDMTKWFSSAVKRRLQGTNFSNDETQYNMVHQLLTAVQEAKSLHDGNSQQKIRGVQSASKGYKRNFKFARLALNHGKVLLIFVVLYALGLMPLLQLVLV